MSLTKLVLQSATVRVRPRRQTGHEDKPRRNKSDVLPLSASRLFNCNADRCSATNASGHLEAVIQLIHERNKHKPFFHFHSFVCVDAVFDWMVVERCHVSLRFRADGGRLSGWWRQLDYTVSLCFH